MSHIFTQTLDLSKTIDYSFTVKEITEENLFKEYQIKKAIETLKIKDRKEQRKHLVFDFYKPKEYIINKIMELEQK